VGIVLVVSLIALASNERTAAKSLASYLFRPDTLGGAGPAWILLPIAADILLYSGMVFFQSIPVSSRVARMTGLLTAPLIFAFLLQCVVLGRRSSRLSACVLMAGLFVIPPALGVLRLAQRVLELGQGQSLNPSGIRNTALGGTVDQARFTEELKAGLRSEDRVLYVTNPQMLLAIPSQRFLLVYVIDKGYTLKQIREMKFRGRPTAGAAILVPAVFGTDSRLTAIKAGFIDFRDWEQVPLQSAPHWQLWRSVPQKDAR
jgi:hypothetical protein